MSKLREIDAHKPSFDGPYLWVHHDAKHRKAYPHQHRVFSHIQRCYHPWRRRKDSKALRTSPQMQKPETDEEVGSPKTALTKGNSDPFGVYPIKIGPEENELVSFYRDVFLPAQYGMRLPIPQLARRRSEDWEGCIGGLTDEGIAHGLFARWGQMVGRCTPKMRAATMEHQYRSTLLLRKKVFRKENLHTYNDYLHINMLFSAETIGRNLYGSLIHGRMLRKMFEEDWERGTLDYKLLNWQVHNDMQNSAMFLTRPVFDVDRFLQMVWAPLRAEASSYMSTTGPVDDNLDPSVEGLLADYFQELRIFWGRLAVRDEQGTTDLVSSQVMIWDSSRDLLSLGRFINHYINTKHLINHGIVSENLQGQLLVQQYLAVAAVWLVKSLNLNPVVLGVPIFDAAPVLLPALRASLEKSDNLPYVSCWQRYENARLWALYVGAMAEQAFPLAGIDPCQQWFNARLAEHAVRMELYTWKAVKLVLLGFLYNDRIPPNGSSWFNRTMSYHAEEAGLSANPRSRALVIFHNFEKERRGLPA